MKDWLKYYCALIILFISPVLAEENLIFYKVEDVHVDVTDSSAMKARTAAIAEAQRRALSSLAERFQVPEGEKIVTALSDEDVDVLVKNFEVTQEKTSHIRYIATFSVQFKPKAVQKLFGTVSPSVQDAAENGTSSGSCVIIPVLVDGEKPLLWQESNDWFNAWNSQSNIDSSIIIPLGDLADIKDVSAQSILTGEYGKITNLLARYNSQKGLFAIIKKQENALSSYQLAVKIYTPNTGLIFSDTISLDGSPDEAASFWSKAIEKTLELAKTSHIGIENQGFTETFPLLIHFNTLEEWIEIQEVMKKTPFIKAVSIEELSLNEAKTQLTCQGDFKTLQDHLKNHGLLLEENSAKIWQLSFNNKIQPSTSFVQRPLVPKSS